MTAHKLAAAGKNLAAFCCCNALIAMLAMVVCFKVCGIEADVWGVLFSVTAACGHFAFIALLLFVLLALVRLCGARAAKVAAVLVGSLLLATLTLDVFVFVYYRMHLNPALLGLFLSPAGRELVPLNTAMWLVLAGVSAAIVALEIACVKLAPRCRRKPLLLFIVFAVVCVPAYNLIFIFAKHYGYAPVLTRAEAIPYLQVLSAGRFLRKLGLAGNEQPTQRQGSGRLKYPLAPLTYDAAPQQPNILVILLDAWRPDAFNEETMPRLYQRARNAVVFDQHYSGGNATRGGVFSFFYGIPATYWHSFLAANREPVLMDAVVRQGYELAIFASSNLTSPEFNRTVFAGVKNLRLSSSGHSSVERDLDAQNGFLDFLAGRQHAAPFFGFLFYDALHSFALPEGGERPFPTDLQAVNYFALTNDTDPGPIANLYKNSAWHLDQQLDQVFVALEQRRLLDNTIVIVSGDHAQEINDSRTNSWGHNINFSKYETQTPLLVFWPGRQPARYTHRTSHLDVAPTLMKQALGCRNPATDFSTGLDLFDPSERPYVIMASYAKTAIMVGDEVFVLDKYGLNQGWNLAYSKRADDLPPKVLKSALMTMRQFYE
ncbi:MAG: sulfatase-like hydrolase/transferase [Verrucomicrobiales bacterium]|jgi:membrane-anchored protein YejM (alkaline phosphatase superfamily)|nr:sulfatase-like hydrolase/transferase [Verrucomicrobiales bacterium]